MQLKSRIRLSANNMSFGSKVHFSYCTGLLLIFCTSILQVFCQHNGNLIRYPTIHQMLNYGSTPILHGQHKHGTFVHGTQTHGNMIMYPSINRMGNYGSNPITYGPPKPSYGGPGKIPGYDLRGGVDILGSFRKAKASILHGAGHALRFKGDAYNSFADSLDMFADGVNPRQRPRPTRPQVAAPPPPPPAPEVVLPLRQNPTRLQLPAGRPPSQFTRLQQQFQQSQKLRQPQQQQQQFQQQPNRILQFNRHQNRHQQQQQFQQPSNFLQPQLQSARLITNGGTCDDRLGQLVGDIFIGHEMIPQVLDMPPEHPLELTYRTIRTYPGMRLTTDATRFNPMMHWPAEPGAYYTIIISNLDINSRKNRSLAEFWHWFVANVPGNSVGEGEEIFQLLHPLVLPEGNGGHRYGYFVMKQPNGLMDYSEEGGPTDNCSPNMSVGRGPYRSTKDFMKKYGLKLTASTFLIVDTSPASIEIACEWQACMGGQVFLRDLTCANAAQNLVSTVKRRK